MKKYILKICIFLSFLLLFVTFINNYLAVKLWDYDFWWHLSTGRYIVENSKIPDKDPFSFVHNLEENKDKTPERSTLILKQYWLAQVLFYKIYTLFGEKGIIILRSSLLFLTVFSVFWWFRREKVSYYITYPFVCSVFVNTMVFTGERPVLFTILFTVLIFIILDDFKKRKSNAIFSLIPLMTLWANLHGGFILGDIVIMTYIAGETINYLRKRGETTKEGLRRLYIAGFIAIAASGINPSGFTAFMSIIPSKEYDVFLKNIQEYSPVYKLYLNKERPIDWEYIVMVLMFPVIIVTRKKKMDVVYYILLCGLFYQGVSALRFMIYYVSVGAMIMGRELHYALEGHLKKSENKKFRLEVLTISLIFISSLLFAGGFLDINRITFRKATNYSVPVHAADFIQSNNIKGNMFNDMGFGGYLIWRLYPSQKVFSDTRSLNGTIINEYGWTIRALSSLTQKELPKGKKPLWGRILDHYDINVVVLDTTDINGTVPPLVLRLIEDNAWVPVYNDLLSAVFLRDNRENETLIKKFRLSDNDVYNQITLRLTQWAMINDKSPRYLMSLGEVFLSMKREEDALKAYEYAKKRFPQSPYINSKIDEITKVLKRSKPEEIKEEAI